MAEIPVFRTYSEANPSAKGEIQPDLGMREFGDLEVAERKIVFQQLVTMSWIDKFSRCALVAVTTLNHRYLRELPGKRVHALGPTKQQMRSGEDYDRLDAGYEDFRDILVKGKGALALELLSEFQECHIVWGLYRSAKNEKDEAKRAKYVAEAFEKFDKLANCWNHIFTQFEINQVMTRGGLVPRQDDAITGRLVEPTMRALSDPKWANVNADLAAMLRDYRDRNYLEVVTKAHTAVHRFLQLWTSREEGKNGQGELSSLVDEARRQGLLPPKDRFIGPVLQSLLSYLPSQRANKSSAKPSVTDVEPAEAMLVINTVFVLLQFCLQKTN